MHHNSYWESWCAIDIRSQLQKYFHAQSTQEHNVNGNWYNGNTIRIATFETKCKFKSTKRIGGFAFWSKIQNPNSSP